MRAAPGRASTKSGEERFRRPVTPMDVLDEQDERLAGRGARRTWRRAEKVRRADRLGREAAQGFGTMGNA